MAYSRKKKFLLKFSFLQQRAVEVGATGRARSLQYHKMSHSLSLGRHTYYVSICDLKNLVAVGHHKLLLLPAENRKTCNFKDVLNYGHNELWRPPAVKRGSCVFKDIMGFDHNKLGRHLATKVCLWLHENENVLRDHSLKDEIIP